VGCGVLAQSLSLYAAFVGALLGTLLRSYYARAVLSVEKPFTQNAFIRLA